MTRAEVGAGQTTRPPDWWLYRGTGQVIDIEERDRRWPRPPRWRTFDGDPVLPPPPTDDVNIDRRLGSVPISEHVDPHVVEMVNAAVYLRRPLLVTGRPGSGKSSLAFQVSRELQLGRVLHWPITTRTTLGTGLYTYDAIGRVQAAASERALGAPSGERQPRPEPGVGDFVHLGPLGTALLPYHRPRVLLIDELDKSDIDLPHDLLNVFEDGEYDIPELLRVRPLSPEVPVHTADPGRRATVRGGQVRCREFPIVIITSNAERDFPPAFLRRCLQLRLPDPDESTLAGMVAAHFPGNGEAGDREQVTQLIRGYLERRSTVGGLAADQLLNAVQLRACGAADDPVRWERLLEAIWHRLHTVER